MNYNKVEDIVRMHPSAIIAPGARLGKNVEIGPWCSIGTNVTIEDDVKLLSHVVVDGHTRLGKNVLCYPFTTIGMAPQDVKYKGEETRCEIGSNTVIREGVTIHRGTVTGRRVTSIGSDCLIMANSHVAHDCRIGDRVIIVNNVVMGGHVDIDDDARIMGAAALHQFIRIGKAALVGGVSGVEADVIPYGSVLGNRARLVGMHWIWLRRHGVEARYIHRLRQAYMQLFPRSDTEPDNVLNQRIQQVKKDFNDDMRVQEIVSFMLKPSRRGLVRASGLKQDIE